MQLFRVFYWDGSSLGRADGGPLFVSRTQQGRGRHDNPSQYGAWYCSRDPLAAVAESLQRFRGKTVDDDDFLRPDGRMQAIATLDFEDSLQIVDLDDPAELSARQLRPSQVATLRRMVTQAIATSIFREGAVGLSWWSTLDAEWTNVTLFHERALPRIRIAQPPRRLTTRDADVRGAAVRLGVAIVRS